MKGCFSTDVYTPKLIFETRGIAPFWVLERLQHTDPFRSVGCFHPLYSVFAYTRKEKSWFSNMLNHFIYLHRAFVTCDKVIRRCLRKEREVLEMHKWFDSVDFGPPKLHLSVCFLHESPWVISSPDHWPDFVRICWVCWIFCQLHLTAFQVHSDLTETLL